MENEQIEALVKYNTYHKEKTRKWQKDISKVDNWQYDETEDTWTCAAGQKLVFQRESKEMTESGYEMRHRHYRSSNCEGCPLKSACTKAQGNREIKISPEYLRYKQTYFWDSPYSPFFIVPGFRSFAENKQIVNRDHSEYLEETHIQKDVHPLSAG